MPGWRCACWGTYADPIPMGLAAGDGHRRGRGGGGLPLVRHTPRAFHACCCTFAVARKRARRRDCRYASILRTTSTGSPRGDSATPFGVIDPKSQRAVFPGCPAAQSRRSADALVRQIPPATHHPPSLPHVADGG